MPVASIPASQPFLDTLAAGLAAVGEQDADPLALTRVTVLLPTRRSCRALREALLRARAGRAALLPRIVPLGDLDEDDGPGLDTLALPSPLPALTRQLMLTRLILARGEDMTPAQATRLAVDLARLLDQAHTEEIDLAAIAALPVKEELAHHWQVTLDFLGLLIDVWPPLLQEWGAVDPALHRSLGLKAQAQAWRERPPAGRIIAAGSTGSIPAAADVLKVVADLPHGLVILPGLDTSLDDASWDALEDTHPQAALKRLLDRFGLTRAQVGSCEAFLPPLSPPPPLSPAQDARARLVTLALRPAATTEAWRHLGEGGDRLSGALDGLTLLNAPGQREEAMAIAVMLREALETEGRTAALVTPDRTLARRVAAALDRWEIAVDDSAGRPLSNTPVGAFLRLVAHACAEQLAPVALLALLQHPLAAAGEAPAVFRARVRRLDREVLRGPRPAPGFAGLYALLADQPPRIALSLRRGLERLEQLAHPFLDLLARDQGTLAELLDAHLRFAEGLAAARIDGVVMPGPARLWAGEAGEAAALALADLMDAAPTLGSLAPRHYPALFETLLAQTPVRPRFDRHPRLAIWGPLEARLQRPDLLILAGLNEGTWPAQSDTGPWMSRPMLQALGLPQPERAVGLAAHDLSQALHAPTLVLSRAARVEGSPTVPSRWLTRLAAVAQAAGLGEAWAEAEARGSERLAWARHLEQPPGPPARTRQPAPRPWVKDRPRRLSVTRVETWMRDPYALYAEHVLRLRELDPLDADPSRADYGTLIHGVLEDFVRAWPRSLPADPEAELLRLGRARFGALMTRPGVRTFWWPRFQRIAAWVARRERERRPALAETLAEVQASLTLEGPEGPFVLTAKADRLERRRDGSLDIIDYKTGALPTQAEVDAGLSPQLPLEAALAQSGAFAGVGAAPVAGLSFWRLSGDAQGGMARPASKDPQAAAKTALAGLQALIRLFDDPATPYIARPHPDHAPRFNPYQHLARVREWAGGED